MRYEEIINLRCFNDIDRHIASYLSEKGGIEDSVFTAVVMLLSSRIFKGDVCLYLNRLAGKSLADFFDEGDSDYEKCLEIRFPEISVIEKILEEHPACGTGMPVVHDKGKLYFSRFMDYEISLADEIKKRCKAYTVCEDIKVIGDLFYSFFPPCSGEADMQSVAAFLSLRNGLTVISGGPGTGKTSVVVKIIQLLIEMSLRKGEELSIALAAPTGKAAARLKESISISLTAAPPSESVLKYIPEKALTIHRLLGYRSYGRYVHNEENPLEHDLVVVDECSMVDLPLMYRLIKGLKPGCRLILLGDRDQLASVEGGAVFGDICDRGNEHGYSEAAAAVIESYLNISSSLPVERDGPEMRDSLAVFTKNFRFKAGSGIGLLADMIKKGDSKGVISALNADDFKDVFFIKPGMDGPAEQIIAEEWDNYFSGRGKNDIIEELIRGFISSFSILTAVRDGDRGMRKMNSIAEEVLIKQGIIDRKGSYYHGQPLMISRNSYPLNIFNGDIGIVAEGCRGVSFPGEDGEFREIPLVRIPEHETAFSMTVHKSQGSEFDNVFAVFPDKWNRVMTRELLYTAVTRARKKVIISAGEDIIAGMVENPVNRSTGLRDRLWQ